MAESSVIGNKMQWETYKYLHPWYHHETKSQEMFILQVQQYKKQVHKSSSTSSSSSSSSSSTSTSTSTIHHYPIPSSKKHGISHGICPACADTFEASRLWIKAVAQIQRLGWRLQCRKGDASKIPWRNQGKSMGKPWKIMIFSRLLDMVCSPQAIKMRGRLVYK